MCWVFFSQLENSEQWNSVTVVELTEASTGTDSSCEINKLHLLTHFPTRVLTKVFSC